MTQPFRLVWMPFKFQSRNESFVAPDDMGMPLQLEALLHAFSRSVGDH
jgi:hypothetical protein